jgi:hypothetical protein
MLQDPKERLVQLFMKPVSREKAEALAQALLVDVAELKLDGLESMERVERAYEAGFYDGRHGTPCEQIEAQNEAENAKFELNYLKVALEKEGFLSPNPSSR